jgi:cathepsin L
MKKNMVAILILIITSIISNSNALELSFSDYHKNYNKSYKDAEEYAIRESIYNKNLELVRIINSNPKHTWKAAINHLADRNDEELKSINGKNYNLKLPKLLSSIFNRKHIDTSIKYFPNHVDWRRKGVISPIRNQLSCGSCWTFSTVATIESHIAIKTGKLLDLSEQQLVSCVENPRHCGGKGGCNGATEELGFDYVAKNGLALEDDFPYLGTEKSCDTDLSTKAQVRLDDFVKLPENDYNALMKTITEIGPVAVSVDATDFALYDSGVFNGFDGECGSEVNHAMVAIGFGTDDVLGDYWILRNSWGPKWGEEGYMRIKREKDAKHVTCKVDNHPENGNGCDDGPKTVMVCGTCGVLSDSSYPKGVKLIK